MNNSEDIIRKAHLLVGRGELIEAKEMLLDAHEAMPDDVQILLGLGVVYEHEGDFISAEEWLEKAAKEDPDNPGIHVHLANTLSRLQKIDKAITHYQTAISINPEIFDAHYCLAELLLVNNQFEDAEYHFMYAIKLNPGDPDYHAKLGQLYKLWYRPEDARNAVNQALKLKRDHVGALTLLGKLELGEKRDSNKLKNIDKDKSTEQPVQFERLSDSCVAFHLKNLFISDNKYLFVTPQDDSCRSCFQRRYITQMMETTRTTQVSDGALSLARRVDDNLMEDRTWQVYSVQDQKLVASFEFIPYEDCPACGKQEVLSRDEVGTLYEFLLDHEPSPRLESLQQQVFSFGFARGRSTTKTTGLANPVSDKLLGNNYHARIIFRMTASDGRYSDDSSMGVAYKKELAELKALMEYIERYAFMMQLGRFQTDEFDDQIINRYLALYRNTVTEVERSRIRSHACLGINLSTREIRPIPLAFIFNKGEVSFIKPSSSGFGAHTDFRKSLCSSVLELVERDAFIRFWYDPQRAFTFEPDANAQSEIDSIISVLKTFIDNEALVSNFFVVQSPTKLPVILATISSQNFSEPPSLSFGFGVGFDLDEALTGALEELRINAINLVKAISVIDGFLMRSFTTRVESIPDRMNFYSTCIPRAKLLFLDNDNPLVDGIVEDEKQAGLDVLVDRFRRINFDIYGIDCTPRCFADKNVFVTRAFSPQLYPMQFEREDVFNLPIGPMSVHAELPHFFL